MVEKCQASAGVHVKQVLLLGSGMVAEPVIEYLTRSPDVKITVASNQEDAASTMANKYRNTLPKYLDASDPEALKQEINKHDLVISLLPDMMHSVVADLCVESGRNMLTASYVTDEMRQIAEKGKEKGIVMFNEVGLDPGIDHMIAMRLFNEIKEKRGIIESFTSYCGGLPAPQYTNNPLRYKFTWLPRAVLLNTLGAAKYLKNGEIVSIKSGDLMSCAEPFDQMPGFNLECFPNRDSTVYKSKYGIESAHTVLRGTLRYKGYSDAMQTLLQVGLFSQQGMELSGYSWNKLVKELLGSKSMSDDVARTKLTDMFNGDISKLNTLKKLGLLDNSPIPTGLNCPFDALLAKLESTLMMPSDESDVVIMNHNVGVRWPSGKCEIYHSNLVVYGDLGGKSAMSKTVGLSVGIAAEMIINGNIKQTGLVLPLTKDIYEPMLAKLEAEGITERREIEDIAILN